MAIELIYTCLQSNMHQFTNQKNKNKDVNLAKIAKSFVATKTLSSLVYMQKAVKMQILVLNFL